MSVLAIFTLERGYGMATYRKRNLKRILDLRKKKSAHLTNKDVVAFLWKKVEETFMSFYPVELNQIQRIRIELTAYTDSLVMIVSAKDATTKHDIRVKRLDDVLMMSNERLKNIDRIMSALLDIAKENDLKTTSYSDKGVLAEDELKYWVVKWTA